MALAYSFFMFSLHSDIIFFKSPSMYWLNRLFIIFISNCSFLSPIFSINLSHFPFITFPFSFHFSTGVYFMKSGATKFVNFSSSYFGHFSVLSFFWALTKYDPGPFFSSSLLFLYWSINYLLASKTKGFSLRTSWLVVGSILYPKDCS